MKMKMMLILAVLMVALPALAAGPFNVKMDPTSLPQWIQVSDEDASASYPVDPALFFPDADVTVSYWDWRGTSMIRLNNTNGTHAFADSVETIFAGTISRPDFPFKAVYITPAAETGGKIEWFE